jgi:hypothetical protein
VNHPLEDILLRLRAGGAARRVAEGELHLWVRRTAMRQSIQPHFLDETVNHAVFVLARLALRGDLGAVQSWDAYPVTILRNKQHDLRRSEKREREGRVEYEAHARLALASTTEELERQRQAEESLEQQAQEAQDVLARIWASAREQVKPSARAGLDATFAQLSAISFKEATLRGLLLKGPLLAGNPGALGRAEAAAHKAHERLRKRLHKTIDELERSHALTPAEAALARRCMALLRRAQGGPPKPGGSHREGDAP